MKNAIIFFTLLLVITGSFNSCKHPAIEEVIEEGAITVAYSEDTVLVYYGKQQLSSTPTVTGEPTISFSTYSTPQTFADEFTVNAKGVIKIDSTLAIGTYKVSVVASNSDGNFIFKEILTVIVSQEPIKPTNLTYEPDTIAIAPNGTYTSAAPFVTGSPTITYSMTINPAITGVTIDATTGKISTTGIANDGDYTIEVTAQNDLGSTVFPAAFVFRVASILPSDLTYDFDTLFVVKGITAMTAAPLILGTIPVTYTMSSPDNSITIDAATGIVMVGAGIAVGDYPLTITAANTAGSVPFSSALVVSVDSVVTYRKNIKSMIVSNCGTCHTGGSFTNYLILSNAQNNINLIIDRVNRMGGETGFMPVSAPKLSPQELAIIQQWLADGLLP